MSDKIIIGGKAFDVTNSGKVKRVESVEDEPRNVNQVFPEFVDKFLEDAELIYKVLESETHQHQYQLVGRGVSVAIRRMPYIKDKKGDEKIERRTEENKED